MQRMHVHILPKIKFSCDRPQVYPDYAAMMRACTQYEKDCMWFNFQYDMDWMRDVLSIARSGYGILYAFYIVESFVNVKKESDHVRILLALGLRVILHMKSGVAYSIILGNI